MVRLGAGAVLWARHVSVVNASRAARGAYLPGRKMLYVLVSNLGVRRN